MVCIEEEIPFDLPIGWSWGRLQSFCFPISDGTHQTPTYTDEGYIFLSAKNVTSWKIDWDNVMHIPESLHNELSKRISPKRNDILLAKNGTIGVAAIVDRDCDFDIYVTLAVLRTIHTSILPQYLLNAIASSTVQNEFRASLKGIGVQNLHLEHIRRTLIPIPPFKEQNLISDKIVEITPLLEHIAETFAELDAGISVLKAKILDLAIRGKLVPQNPDDEPASALLERIRAEKEVLIKQGKIKRDKKESVIFKGDDNSYYEKIGEKISCIDDEIQFEIPNSWEWCSITNISEIIMGSSPDGLSIQPIGKGVEFHQGKIYFTDKYIGLSDKSTNEPSKIAPANSVLLCVRAPVGEVNITQREICIGRGLSAIYPYGAISSNFLFYWLRTYKTYLNLQATGSTFVAITADTVKGIKIPLPPIEEQKRIVQTIESLYAQLNNIEKSLG